MKPFKAKCTCHTRGEGMEAEVDLDGELWVRVKELGGTNEAVLTSADAKRLARYLTKALARVTP